MPHMIVVAGPPGGGKSTAFPIAAFGVDFFNADDRAAELNLGLYSAIPPYVRAQVNQEFEAFVERHIHSARSLAFETTLRSEITLRQAADAKQKGFTVWMKYLAIGDFGDHLERVAARAQGGGHAASATTLRNIYDASLRNLPAALRAIDNVEVFDNAAFARAPRLVLECVQGKVVFIAPEIPTWLNATLRNTEFEITARLRTEAKQRSPE
jgi:predicted ABC-type ATPase